MIYIVGFSTFAVLLILFLTRTKKSDLNLQYSIFDSHYNAQSIFALIEKDEKLKDLVQEVEGLKNQIYRLQDKEEAIEDIENDVGSDVMSAFETGVINSYPVEFITLLFQEKWQKTNLPNNNLIFSRNNRAFMFPGPFLEIFSKVYDMSISSSINFLSMSLKRMKVTSETIIDNTSLDIGERGEQYAKMRDKIINKIEWDDEAFEKFVNYLLDQNWGRDREGKNVPLDPNTIFHNEIKNDKGIIKKTIKIYMRNRILDPDFLLKICEVEEKDIRDIIIDLRLLLDIIID